MERMQPVYDPDCVHRDDSDMLTCQKVSPFFIDERLFVPADGSMIAVDGPDQADPKPVCVKMMLTNGSVGFFENWTPEGAREFAQTLAKAADEADAHNAKLAAEQLRATLDKGKR